MEGKWLSRECQGIVRGLNLIVTLSGWVVGGRYLVVSGTLGVSHVLTFWGQYGCKMRKSNQKQIMLRGSHEKLD